MEEPCQQDRGADITGTLPSCPRELGLGLFWITARNLYRALHVQSPLQSPVQRSHFPSLSPGL